jgi:hypothetical protein
VLIGGRFVLVGYLLAGLAGWLRAWLSVRLSYGAGDLDLT